MSSIFLDISSSCTGYVVSNEGLILDVGVVWFPKDNSITVRCEFLRSWFVAKVEEHSVENLVYERYSFNLKTPNGSLACPQIQGAVLSASSKLTVSDIPPQTWRKQCGLKKSKTENWKKVTEKHFRSVYDIPDKIGSNITGNMRTTPSDYFDALGICIGWHNLNKLNIKWRIK